MKKLMAIPVVSIFLIIFSGCAAMHYNRGVTYLEQEKYPEAINSLETVLEKNPKYLNAHTQLRLGHNSKNT